MSMLDSYLIPALDGVAYGLVLFLAAGLLLLALTYLLLRGSLPLPPPTPDDNIGGRLRQEAISDLLTRAALALLVVTALAGLTGWLVAGLILRPIRAISGTANRLSAENLSERVPVGRPADELATLAATINGMLDRIQHGMAERDRVLNSQRLFVANAAHEQPPPAHDGCWRAVEGSSERSR